MRQGANVVILAKVTAQYFFYKVCFMYLLYILCIGLRDRYWNNAEDEMFYACDSAAILERTWMKRHPATSNPANATNVTFFFAFFLRCDV